MIRPPQRQQVANCFLAPAPRNNQPQQPPQQFRQWTKNRCYPCGNIGHYTKDCLRNQPRPKPIVASDKGKKQKVQVKQGRLNFTNLEDLPEGAPIMTSIFFVLNQPAIILFDFGASHSFISRRFSVKCHLPFFHTKGTYMIAMPGGKVATYQLNHSLLIQLGSKICKTSLLVLGIENVDTILGTDWITQHQVLMDVISHH